MIAALSKDCPSNGALHPVLGGVPADEPDTEIIRMLEFVIDGTCFAVDLDEVRKILMSVNLGHTGESPTIIPGIIRRNRKNTVMLDLNYCIYLQWGLGTGRGKTRLLMLDDKNGTGPLGILLSGFSSIKSVRHSRNARSVFQKNSNPVKGVFRQCRPATDGCTEKNVIWIDPSVLVENCRTCVQHMSPAQYAGGIA